TDGYEQTFAVNHLSHYLLTSLLIDRRRVTPGARIVNVSSAAHRKGVIDFRDLQSQASYDGYRAYRASKLAQILFTYELARRLRPDEDVTVNCCHPGWVASGFGLNNGWVVRAAMVLARPLQMTPAEGADTPVYLACSEEVTGITGKYFVRRRS